MIRSTAISLLLLVLFIAGQTSACSCLRTDFCERYAGAPTVLRGQILRALPVSGENGELKYQVLVVSAFKSSSNILAGSRVVVSTGSSLSSCAQFFEAGQQWLLFLNDDLSTGLCAGNQWWSDTSASQRLFLRNPKPCSKCDTILCPSPRICRVDDLGVAACVLPCILPCPSNLVCKLNDNALCLQYPCQPLPTCSNPCKDFPCGEYQNCEVFRGEAYCADTCEGRPCPALQHCELQQVQCIRAPCPAHAVCVPDRVETNACATVRCSAFQECKIYEPTGEAYCADTCEGRKCPNGQMCELQEVQCIRAPCPPIAHCACPSACIDIYQPVCGSDGQTYGNSCQLSVASCNQVQGGGQPITQAHEGEC